ncbi:MAG: glycosyl hydrolase, partial [Terriglobia bacterium]
MDKINRRGFMEVTALGLAGVAMGPAWALGGQQGSSGNGLQSLYEKFEDPDRRYSIRPFWFWNGKLEGGELRRQIKQMVDHGVYGAYAHNRDGLETPYLSESWWQAVGEALKAAREYGFSLCMVDEFEWPSGEARDYWMPGINKSRVVAANPDFHMRRLRADETHVQGPRQIRIVLPNQTAAVVVGRLIGRDTLEGESLKTLPIQNGAKQIEWNAPEGDWIVFAYGVEEAIGQPDHGTVDLMSRDAIAKYIEIYYEEFYRRYGEYFGSTMPATFADHEGDYGAKLPWTPALLGAFRRKAGYSLEAYLPALKYDIGTKTEKVRCDLLDTVSELYSDNFFKQVTDWCQQHKIDHSGHVWEESLFFGPAEQGDFFRILRSLSNPGCDTLVEWGRQSVWLKEDASVADFEGRHVVCENQGVQGEDSYLSPERMRRVSNCLGAWNIGEFIPHAFDYDLSRINYPPDWFRSQPYLPWFRAYADQMRRISFINRESHYVADIALLYPQVSIWGQSAPAFRSEDFGYLVRNTSWTDDASDTNQQYAQLKLRLSE